MLCCDEQLLLARRVVPFAVQSSSSRLNMRSYKGELNELNSVCNNHDRVTA